MLEGSYNKFYICSHFYCYVQLWKPSHTVFKLFLPFWGNHWQRGPWRQACCPLYLFPVLSMLFSLLLPTLHSFPLWGFKIKTQSRKALQWPIPKIRWFQEVSACSLSFIVVCPIASGASLQICFFFITAPTCGSLAVQVWLAAQMYDTVKQELHRCFTRLDVLSEP